MDIKLEKKKGWRAIFQKKNLPYAAVAVLVAFIGWLILRDNSSTLRVDAGLVNIATVEQGEFNDYVRLTGSVQPMTTVQLSPLESGVVERIVAEEGTQVKRGDVILEMSNNSLSMQILQSEADLAEEGGENPRAADDAGQPDMPEPVEQRASDQKHQSLTMWWKWLP